MKKRILLLSFFCFVLILASSAQTPSIDEMLEEISADSLRRTVVDLQNFGSRFALREGGNREVAEYVAGRLNAYGIPAIVDTFYATGDHWIAGHYEQWFYNVKGVLEAPNPMNDSIVIIGAHLDAIATTPNYNILNVSPGADDNASGTAVMIEMARIFQHYGLSPALTVNFMAYDGEELGLFGSVHDAWCRTDVNDKISIMLNNDMVSYQPDDDWKLTLHWYENAIDLAERAADICSQYTDIEPIIPSLSENGDARNSDSHAYYEYGFRPVFAIEHTFSTSYHTDHDVADSNNYDYLAHVARYNLGMLYHFAIAPTPTSIMQTETDARLMVYPNPTSGTAMVRLPWECSSQTLVTITDMMGKVVKMTLATAIADGANLVEIDLTSLPAGIYVCTVSNNDKRALTKVVKSSKQ